MFPLKEGSAACKRLRRSIRIGPAPHRVSRARRTRNPGRVRPESRKSPPGRDPQSPDRVRPGVSKESEKSPKVGVLDSFRTLLRLRGALFSGLWGSRFGGLFRDSFRTLPGFRARRARETLCWAGPILSVVFHYFTILAIVVVFLVRKGPLVDLHDDR